MADLDWKDISQEVERVYFFPDGSEFHIKNPKRLAVSPSGTHRVIDSDGQTYWVRSGFTAIRWQGPTTF